MSIASKFSGACISGPWYCCCFTEANSWRRLNRLTIGQAQKYASRPTSLA